MMLIQKPQPKYITPVKGIYSVTVTDVRRMPANFAEIDTMKNGGNCYTIVKPAGGDDALC